MSLHCIHAYASLATEPDGSTKICCMSSQRFSANGQELNLSKDDIESSWKHPLREEVISALEKGEEHPNCNLCWSEEAAGKASKRIRDNQFYKDVTPKSDQPVIVDLKLGHLCNLKCRSCGSHSSSKWIEEEFATNNGLATDLVSYRKKFEGFKKSFAEENPLWDTLGRWSKDVVHFDFYGGEPMLINKHWEILQNSIATGSAHLQVIKYNTNGTIFPDKYIDLYRNFKGLDVSISLDGVEKKFEYLRHPAKWTEVLKNLEKWQVFIKQLDIPFKALNLCLTVSSLNVFYLDEFLHALTKLGFPQLFLNIVHMPEYLCIQNIPDELKLTLSNKVESGLKGHPMLGNVREILNYMNQRNFDPEKWQEFLNKTSIHDGYRKESFSQTFPEYFEFLGRHVKGA